MARQGLPRSQRRLSEPVDETNVRVTCACASVPRTTEQAMNANKLKLRRKSLGNDIDDFLSNDCVLLSSVEEFHESDDVRLVLFAQHDCWLTTPWRCSNQLKEFCVVDHQLL